MDKKKKSLTLVALFLLLFSQTGYTLTFDLPPGGESIVGEVITVNVKKGDTLFKIARKYDIGFEELYAVNPRLKQTHLKAGTKVMVPTAFVLPNAPRDGIVINLPEMRLYYYPVGENVVLTFPIGIGREGWETPTSITYISDKEEFPTWHVPKSIRDHVLKTKGKLLPKAIGPGPNNPLGDYAIRLALKGYLIHSTNNPHSIGKRSSSGCIRMFPEDAEELFYLVKVGTPVYIVHSPVKAGWFRNEFYVEAHKPLSQYYLPNIGEEITYQTRGVKTSINWQQTTKVVRDQHGIPIYVGERVY